MDAHLAPYSREHELHQRAAQLKAELKQKRKRLQHVQRQRKHKDPASYYEGATDPPDAKRRKTACRPTTTQDPVDHNPVTAHFATVPHPMDLEEHDPHADEAPSSSPHPAISPHSAIDLLAAMGYKLPPGTILERTQTTLPSDIALLSHVSDTIAKAHRPASPTSTIMEFMDSHCLDSIYFAAQECCPIDDSTNFDDWLACRALAPNSKHNHPDVLTQSQMLRAEDSHEFVSVQREEIRGLQGARVFAYKKRSSLPEGASILNSIWSYRRKRRPDGTLLKMKSRICADGSMQEQGRDFTESYAPVVQWSSVRLCLVLAAMLGLPTH